MNDIIYMTKKGIVNLKQAEILVVRMLNKRRASEFWHDLNEILFLIRDAGARTQEYEEELKDYV